MRCLFTMFAEDVDLIPKKSFQTLLEKCIERPETFTLRLKQLWSEMEKGAEFSHVIETRVRHFNGGLFKNATAFELGCEQIGELLVAAKAEWREVDPAIFGTLLEQALDPQERRKLGAHYTPRAYSRRESDARRRRAIHRSERPPREAPASTGRKGRVKTRAGSQELAVSTYVRASSRAPPPVGE